jgi:hypothetical protein
MHQMSINPNQPIPHSEFQKVAFESFKTNFDDETMELAKSIYA